MRLLGPATASSLVTFAGAMFGVTLTNEAIILFFKPCISLDDALAPVDLRQELFCDSYLLYALDVLPRLD